MLLELGIHEPQICNNMVNLWKFYYNHDALKILSKHHIVKTFVQYVLNPECLDRELTTVNKTKEQPKKVCVRCIASRKYQYTGIAILQYHWDSDTGIDNIAIPGIAIQRQQARCPSVSNKWEAKQICSTMVGWLHAFIELWNYVLNKRNQSKFKVAAKVSTLKA